MRPVVRLSCALALALLVVGTAGCATLMKGSSSARNQVVLRNAKTDLAVLVDGKPVKLRMINTGMGRKDGREVWIREPSVDLDPTRQPSYELTFRSGGRVATLKVERAISMTWVVMDVFLGLGVGVLVDAATGAWYEIGDGVLNVEAILEKHGKPFGAPDAVAPSATLVLPHDAPLLLAME